ncbi:MAG: ComEC/Rec2 family competence protein [Spirochaetota bacterium]
MSALVPSAAFATGGILWAASGRTLPLFLIVATVAAGLALCCMPVARRREQRAGGLVALCAAALVLGAGSQSAGETATRVHLPVAAGEVRRAEGRLLGVAGDSDSPVATVRLASASSEWVTAGASGTLRVIAAGRLDAPVGGRVALRLDPHGASIWRDDAGRLWARAVVSAAPAVGPPSPTNVPGRLRETIGEAVDEVSGAAAPLARALLIGDDATIDPRVQLLFRRSGTLHLLALSGMHLAVIALLVRGAAGAIVGRRTAAWIAVAAGFAYVVLAGPRPGLVRAALLVLFATGTTALDRPRPLVELLAACFLVQLLAQPSASGSLAFQLSYLSLFGIAAVAQPIADAVRPWIPPAVAGPLGAGVGAQLATTPLALARFGYWFPVGIVASLVLGPLVLLVMVSGLAAVAVRLAGLTGVATIARPLLETLSRAVEALAWLFSGAPSVRAGGGPWIAGSVVVGAIALGAGLVRQTRGAPR